MSRLHLLDTNIYRAWVEGKHERHAEVVRRVGELGGTYAYVSVVTVAEVEFGLSRPHRLSTELVQEIRRGLSEFRVLAINHHVAEPYGKLRAWLVEKYGPKNKRRFRSLSQLADPITDIELGIQENDLWLVSQAITVEAVLVTFDRMTHLRQAVMASDLDLPFAQW